MDSLVSPQFENICRTCMHNDFENSNQFVQLQSVFYYVNDFEEKKIQICDLLNITITQLPKIVANDHLPKFVCKLCVEKACAFYEFQSCCIKSDLNLRKLIATDTNSDLTDPLQNATIESEITLQETVVSNDLNDSIQTKVNDSKFDTKETDEIITSELKYSIDTSNIMIKDEMIEDSCEESSIEEFMSIKKTSENIKMAKNNKNGEQEFMVLKPENEILNNISYNEQGPIQSKEQTKSLLSKHGKNGPSQCGTGLKDTTEWPTTTTESVENVIKNEFLLISDLGEQIPISLSSENEHISNEGDSLLYSSNIDNADTDSEKDNEFLNEQKLQCNDKLQKSTNKTWQCSICQRIFAAKRSLQRHAENIHGKSFYDIQVFTNDEESQKPLLFKCDQCIRVFKNFNIFNKHKLQHSKPPKEATKRTKVKNHEQKHINYKQYLCIHCGKQFSFGSTLRQHLLRHGNEKRHVCPHCPKKFFISSDLRKHVIQVHNPEKPFSCDICGAEFKTRGGLNVHKLIHTEKRFQCENCDKRFALGVHLRRHMRIHTGEKPFKCKYCTKAFNDQNKLKKHTRLHLGDNIYQCELCPASFRLDRELRAHFASHKNDDEETKERNRLARLEILKQLEQKLVNILIND